MNIQDSTVLVTGANRGIGKAFADALLDRGARKVYAAVRDVTTVTDPRLVAIQLDVTEPDRIAAVARELDDVQVVVNNAGVLHVAVPLSASLDVARLELTTNYLGLISMMQAFAPVLERNGGGAFINVLSVFSWVATPLIATYSASKAAAWSFTNAARIELRRQDTQVVGVHAGPVDTDMAAAFDFEKIPPATVATSALDALEADEPEAFADEYSRAIKAELSDDQQALYPQIEREFLALTGAETPRPEARQMDYALIGTIARLTNTRPNWDREVTRAVGAARACAIAALIRALGAEVEYADLRGIELFQAKPDLPDRPLRATNPIVRDLPSVKHIYEQEGHAIAPVSVDIESLGAVIAAIDLTFEVGRYEPRIPLR